MKKLISEIIALFLVLIATLGVILGTILFKNNPNSEIELLARAPERGNWYPEKIIVKKDNKVNILIRNVDTVSHGFYLPAFDITAGEIKGGEAKRINFFADKKGEFPFYCTVWCGDYHMQMRGIIIIK